MVAWMILVPFGVSYYTRHVYYLTVYIYNNFCFVSTRYQCTELFLKHSIDIQRTSKKGAYLHDRLGDSCDYRHLRTSNIYLEAMHPVPL